MAQRETIFSCISRVASVQKQDMDACIDGAKPASIQASYVYLHDEVAIRVLLLNISPIGSNENTVQPLQEGACAYLVCATCQFLWRCAFTASCRSYCTPQVAS